jgi:hypothetical protein
MVGVGKVRWCGSNKRHEEGRNGDGPVHQGFRPRNTRL